MTMDSFEAMIVGGISTVKIDEIGAMEHWSTDGLRRHLCLLGGLVP